jgi:hypothetical protein
MPSRYHTDFEYSEKEMALIAYFGYTNIADRVSANSIYRMMMEKAFITDDRSTAAESIRRCLIALEEGEIYRMTDEWDRLIVLPIKS